MVRKPTVSKCLPVGSWDMAGRGPISFDQALPQKAVVITKLIDCARRAVANELSIQPAPAAIPTTTTMYMTFVVNCITVKDVFNLSRVFLSSLISGRYAKLIPLCIQPINALNIKRIATANQVACDINVMGNRRIQ
mmetsp:Transcript_20856/g.32661  ORF Transcript_20856/g.32661 Transcript_20856/m.32661 type:complete len:136 (-) Transcript_20856:132-539(-)